MKTVKNVILIAVAGFALTACTADATNRPAANVAAANTNAAPAKPAAPAAPTKDALMALEKQGWESWKNHTPEAFEAILSSKYVGFGKDGRMDKAATVKSFADSKCNINSYSYSDEQMNMIGADVAVLSFKASQDGECNGKKVPAEVWSSSVYIREGDGWKNVLYTESPVIDPNAKPAQSTAVTSAPKPAETAAPDAFTDQLMAVEKAGWDAWKSRDAAATESVMSKDFMYVSGGGRRDRAASVKTWSEPKCEGLEYTFSDPKGVSLSKDVALVTYKADVKGTCDGKPVDPHLWVASFDLREGDAWKNAFYTDTPR